MFWKFISLMVHLKYKKIQLLIKDNFSHSLNLMLVFFLLINMLSFSLWNIEYYFLCLLSRLKWFSSYTNNIVCSSKFSSWLYTNNSNFKYKISTLHNIFHRNLNTMHDENKLYAFSLPKKKKKSYWT